MKKYERIAGSEEALLLKEALEKLSGGSLSSSLEAKLDLLIGELRLNREQRQEAPERPIEVVVEAQPAPPPVDIERLIASMGSANSKPTYKFKVERNTNGLLVGITATPE